MFKHTAATAAMAMAVGCLLAAAGTAQAQPTAGAAASAAPDPAVARGRLLFLRCASCHEVEDRGVVKAGPSLKGVFGRPAAALPGYAYSAGLKAHSSLAWDAPTLDQWLERPTQLVPDTSMAFIGLPLAQDRKALIAYLQTLK